MMKLKKRMGSYLRTRQTKRALLSASGLIEPRVSGFCEISIRDVAMFARTEEDFFIVKEVFLESCYNFENEATTIVFDIGMNIGIASLFFANKRNVQKVYSFEPFKPTYDLGLKNFSLNPTLKGKICPYNFGLSDHDAVLQLPYADEMKGRAGINYVAPGVNGLQTISLQQASKVLSPLINGDGGIELVLKVDCEGSEYAVIEDLCGSGVLSRFTFLMIEWHRKGPRPLINLLREVGFDIFSVQSADDPTGLIYAVKRNCLVS